MHDRHLAGATTCKFSHALEYQSFKILAIPAQSQQALVTEGIIGNFSNDQLQEPAYTMTLGVVRATRPSRRLIGSSHDLRIHLMHF